MKTLLLIALAAATLTAHAQSDSMQEKLDESDAKIQAELDRKYTSKDGIEIRNVKKEDLDRTIKQLGGNVTVEFGKEKERQIQVRKGGVHVGSGANSLLARTNTQPGSPTVVQVPLQPKMSITLLGGKSLFCVFSVVRNQDGSLAKGQTSFANPESNGGGCAISGNPVRVRHAGTYLVEVNKSSMFVELNQDENKVIPLREIVIPFPTTANPPTIKFTIYPDLESSVSEREKVITKAYLNDVSNSCNSGSGDVCQAYYRANTLESYLKLMAFRSTPSLDLLGVKAEPVAGGWTPAARAGIAVVLHEEWFTPRQDIFATFGGTETAPEAFKYYVLPGVYGIKWLIDSNIDVTKGIYVQ
jgi:hypothetical protein